MGGASSGILGAMSAADKAKVYCKLEVHIPSFAGCLMFLRLKKPAQVLSDMADHGSSIDVVNWTAYFSKVLAEMWASIADSRAAHARAAHCVSDMQLKKDLAALFPGFVFLGGAADVPDAVSTDPAPAPSQVCLLLS